MITQFYSFILTFFFKKNTRNCLICLEGGFTKNLPCNICKNKYIHQKCLDQYRAHNIESRPCFVCNTGTLIFIRSRVTCNCIKITIPRDNLMDRMCLVICETSIFLFYLILGIMSSTLIFSFTSTNIIGDDFFPIFFLIGLLIGIFYWYLHKKEVCQCIKN